ncbi:MAG: hypothetical protein OEX76_07965 [Candidatus Bathyarchaeota archaeon]|nr:hypothetical protein [Candidatus Bathyarchaeota archaeon]MDH5532724.1 hypothetical protein [Candidatus Bathyarchaeota archaeon]MDH5712709.1 hypothetical protein [Candidatus Bathyarchaeota archaeon]
MAANRVACQDLLLMMTIYVLTFFPIEYPNEIPVPSSTTFDFWFPEHITITYLSFDMSTN